MHLHKRYFIPYRICSPSLMQLTQRTQKMSAFLYYSLKALPSLKDIEGTLIQRTQTSLLDQSNNWQASSLSSDTTVPPNTFILDQMSHKLVVHMMIQMEVNASTEIHKISPMGGGNNTFPRTKSNIFKRCLCKRHCLLIRTKLWKDIWKW